MAVWAVMMTSAQEQTDIAFQGRLTSLFFSLGSVVVLVIFFLMSVVSFYFNVRAIYTFEVLIALLATYLSWRLFKQEESVPEEKALDLA